MILIALAKELNVIPGFHEANLCFKVQNISKTHSNFQKVFSGFIQFSEKCGQKHEIMDKNMKVWTKISSK
jgi:hypothetical protein